MLKIKFSSPLFAAIMNEAQKQDKSPANIICQILQNHFQIPSNK